MSEKNKENSVVFSNKELKDAANTPSAEQASPKKRASFIDDAGSILSDIKSAIGDEVAEELKRFEEERRSAAEAVLQREQALQEARRAEIQARRAAEEARRQAAAEEREALMTRLKEGPEPEVQPEPVAPTSSPVEPTAFTQPPSPKSKMPVIFGVAALLVTVVGYFAVNSGPKDTGVSTPAQISKPTPTSDTPVPPPNTATAKTATPKAAPIAVPSTDAGVAKKDRDGSLETVKADNTKTASDKKTDSKKSAQKNQSKRAKKGKRKKSRRKAKRRKRKKKKKKKKKKYEIDLDNVD